MIWQVLKLRLIANRWRPELQSPLSIRSTSIIPSFIGIMKVVPTALLLGTAAASVQPAQQVLNWDSPKDIPQKVADAASQPLQDLKEHLKSLKEDAKELFEEVSNLFPDSLNNIPFYSLPKKHTRRPDSDWDYIIRGSDVQALWVENANGEKEREVDGRLEAFDLRVRSVDPSVLGVDPGVKQFSGYLDNNDEDKHLFFCKSFHPIGVFDVLTLVRVLRVAQ